MTQILLGGKIYTVEGDDAVLLREAVANFEKTASETKTALDAATAQVTTLTTEKTALDTKANKLEADLTATKTKLDEATTKLEEKTDADDIDFDGLIKERLELWADVLPVIRKDDENYEPNYDFTPLEIKVEYLFKTCADKEEIINGLKERKDKLEANDPAAVAYVDAMYLALYSPSGSSDKPSHTDSVLGSIMFGRHISTSGKTSTSTKTDGRGKEKVDYRQKQREAIEAKNPGRKKKAT